MNDNETKKQQALDLGKVLGRRETFGLVAGRCSAAQADCFRKIKEERLWVDFAANWDEYCEQVLKISRRTVERSIGLLKKHGPMYFDVAALTGASPAEYAAIEKHVRPDGIHIGSEVIALIPGNTDRAVQAVAQLQRETREASAPESTAQQQISALTKRGHGLAKAFRRIAKTANQVERRVLRGCVTDVARDLDRILLEYTK
jgi:hypothetical protein